MFVISDGHYTSEPQAQGPQLVNEAFNHIQAATYWVNEDGTDNWIINNVRVSQTIDGLVRFVYQPNKNKLLLLFWCVCV